ncbi:zinc protease [Effusibacillus lacus]|uniref:Zinc protease n=1 Tax=Effusibacillus lacus TaxID=1348429 RepID=A0A292YJQ6_9BACL|nr:zinc protease [Effusibacillus lacus]
MQTRRTQLPNGLRILTQRTPHYRGAVALFRFGVGSAYESSDGWGTAHFLEHMIFQGTADKDHDTLMMELARLGATANASTGFESTVFELTSPAETLLPSLHIMSEMLDRFHLAPELIDLERDIILEEWRMTRDEPSQWGEDCLYHQVLGDFGHPILGTEESLQSMDRKRLLEFANAYYTPDNMIVSVVGDVEHERIVEALGQWFGDNRSKALPKPLVPIRQSYRLHSEEEHELLHVFFGFHAPPLGSGRLPAFDVLGSVLGGDSWSRLFRKVRNELGLAYSISGFYSGWQDMGLFGVQSATQPDQAQKLVDTIRHEISVVQHDLTEDEVELAKAVLQANILFGSDQVGWRAERILHDEAVFGKMRGIEEDLQAITNVKREDVLELAEFHLDLGKSTLVTVGNVDVQ